MADEISRVEYYVAAIPHKAGEGARVLTAFKDAGMMELTTTRCPTLPPSDGTASR